MDFFARGGSLGPVWRLMGGSRDRFGMTDVSGLSTITDASARGALDPGSRPGWPVWVLMRGN